MSSDKNEILFKRFGINYNNEPEIYKKGSVVYRQVGDPSPGPFLGALDKAHYSSLLHQYQTEESDSTAESNTPEEKRTETSKPLSKTQQDKIRKLYRKAQVVVDHVDIIKDEFWDKRPWVLSNRPGKLPG